MACLPKKNRDKKTLQLNVMFDHKSYQQLADNAFKEAFQEQRSLEVKESNKAINIRGNLL
jgi:hypothetical protein